MTATASLTLGLAAAFAYAAVTDVRSLRIPNPLVAGLLAAWIGAVALLWPGLGTVVGAIAWATAILAAGIALFARGWFGAGDTKLLAVAALWTGPEAVPQLLAMSALFGGALSLALLALRAPQVAAVPLPAWTALRAGAVPYGVAISGAAILTFVNGSIVVTGG